MYNLTDLQAASTVSELVAYANTGTDGLLFNLFVLSVFFVLMMSFRWDFDDRLLVTGFLCFVLSLILAYGKFIKLFPLVYLFLAVMAFTALYQWFIKK